MNGLRHRVVVYSPEDPNAPSFLPGDIFRSPARFLRLAGLLTLQKPEKFSDFTSLRQRLLAEPPLLLKSGLSPEPSPRAVRASDPIETQTMCNSGSPG